MYWYWWYLLDWYWWYQLDWYTHCIALNRYPDPFHSRLCRPGQQDCQIVGCLCTLYIQVLPSHLHLLRGSTRQKAFSIVHCALCIALCWSDCVEIEVAVRIKFPFHRFLESICGHTFSHSSPAIWPFPILYSLHLDLVNILKP